MRRNSYLTCALGVVVAVLGLSFTGCAAPGSTGASATGLNDASADPGGAASDKAPVPGSPQDLARQAQQRAEQMAAAMAIEKEKARQGDASAVEALVPRVRWNDEPNPPVAARPAPPPLAPPLAAAVNPATAKSPAPTPAPAAGATAGDVAAGPAAKRGADAATQPHAARLELLNQLRDSIRRDPGSDLSKALTLAALSLADSDPHLDPADLQPLRLADRQLVERYQRLVLSLAHELAAGGYGLDAESIARHIESVVGRQVLTIRSMRLCRRVKGYGVYETLASHGFLAGRENRVIVYAELDNFTVVKSPVNADQNQVRLKQEVVLYNESDGLAVWKQAPVELVDESRNRRRDFFVVQLIKLPDTLTVGKYVLKLRVSDVHGGSVDEASAPIEIVADRSLVGKP